jgi:purine-binding chemotaxis protein CheW
MKDQGMERVVIFEIDAQRFGLPLERVEQALRVVAITPLPHAPILVSGVIDVRGSVVPVIDVRSRFGLRSRAPLISDQLLIANTSTRRLALCVDSVSDVSAYHAEDFSAAAEVVAGMEYLKGIVRLADGLVLIHDLDTLLSLEEARALDRACAEASGDA